MELGTIGLYYALLIAMVLWMAIRVHRVSSGMAIATFVCWPLAIIPLVANWGSRDSDIRLPFLVAVLAFGMILHSADEIAAEAALAYTPEEIEALRSEDPQFAAEIEREQARALGFDVEQDPIAAAPAGNTASTFATFSMGPDRGGGYRPVAVAADRPPAESDSGEMQFAPAPRQIRKVPLQELRFRRGQVRLGQAFARLDVPQHFRFLSAQQLGTLAELRGVTVSDATLGWLVHERVDLGAPDFWFVDVQFHESGHLSGPDAEATDALPGTSMLTWDEDRAVAVWSTFTGGAAARKELASAKLMRHGAIVYRLPDLDADQAELGLRTARLMAARTLPEPGWGHGDFTGADSTQSITDWIEARWQASAATTLPPAVAVEAAQDRRS